MIYSLGISAYSHDSAAALLGDGKVLAMVEQERINREKYTTVFPEEAIRACLGMAGISLEQVNTISFFNRPGLELWGGIRHGIRYFPKSLHLFRGTQGTDRRTGNASSFFARVQAMRHFPRTLADAFDLDVEPKVEYVEHHLAHAASCYYPSPFEEAAVLTWDGRGEIAATLGAVASPRGIRKVFQVDVPHSLGFFYAGITDYLGFRPFHDEWKVMGLSAYGTAKWVTEFEELILAPAVDVYRLNLSYFDFQYYGRKRFFSRRFFEKFGPPRKSHEPLDARHFDVAFAAQRLLEKTGLAVADELQRRTGLERLCLSGGVSQNILLNSFIMENSRFKDFFIQPVATDAGTAYGSALFTYHRAEGGRAARHRMSDVYWGPEFPEPAILAALRAAGAVYERPADIAGEVAQSLHEGRIVCWFQGRMEAGPRALGNRSLLANPTKLEHKERLNRLIKKRESFRPFAPAVLAERAAEFFCGVNPAGTDFMVASARVREAKAALIPAVIHVDGTARPQTVREETNPRFWKMISEFEKLSGVPMVLNTSFNEQEPIVCSPEHAIATFLRTPADELAIGPFLVRKKDQGAATSPTITRT